MKVKVRIVTTTEAATTKVTISAEELKMILKEMKQQEKNPCNCSKATTTAPVTPAKTQEPTPAEKPVAPVTKDATNVTPQTQEPTPTTEKPVASPVAKATKEADNDKHKVVHTGIDPQAPKVEEENLLGISEDTLKILKSLGLVELCGDSTIVKLYEDKILADVIYGDTKDKALFDTIVSFENHGISVDDVCNGVYDYYRNGSVVSKHKIESEFRLRGIEAMFNAEYKKRGGKGYVHLTDTYRGRMYVTYPTIAAAF